MWFWRTAQGDEVDLLLETAPEQFVAIECKTSERVDTGALTGIRKLAEEYGAAAVAAARVVCRTVTPRARTFLDAIRLGAGAFSDIGNGRASVRSFPPSPCRRSRCSCW